MGQVPHEKHWGANFGQSLSRGLAGFCKHIEAETSWVRRGGLARDPVRWNMLGTPIFGCLKRSRLIEADLQLQIKATSFILTMTRLPQLKQLSQRP
jgi:hypothetical protein